MTHLLAPEQPLARFDGDVVRIDDAARDQVRSAVLAFLDASATATGRATFYNTRDEQLAAEQAIHDALFRVNRGLYAAMLTLPGVNDHTIMAGLQRLLGTAHPGEGLSFLDHGQEAAVLDHLTDALPPQRRFKLFGALKGARVNNRRTRRVILRGILAGDRLPLWAVKYRRKLRTALRHALGTGVASGIAARTARDQRTTEDEAWLHRHLGRYLPAGADRDEVYQCVCFILDGRPGHGFRVPLLKAFHEARFDLERGQDLPVEVLGGIRSRYHRDVPHGRVLELARDSGSLTEGQKLAMKRSAQKHEVELELDPTRADMVRLYVYALECGMTPAIRATLDGKAHQAARQLPIRYEKVGIVVDRSASMEGTAQGKYRPLAVALALRDILAASAAEARVVASHGRFDDVGLVRPVGETSLARALVDLFQDSLDAVYLLTDGYENAPAGRVDEVLRALRGLGVATPVYQLTPVLASETAGIRRLSDEVAPLPVTRPEGLGLALVRAALTGDIERGILGLLRMARPLLTA